VGRPPKTAAPGGAILPPFPQEPKFNWRFSILALAHMVLICRPTPRSKAAAHPRLTSAHLYSPGGSPSSREVRAARAHPPGQERQCSQVLPPSPITLSIKVSDKCTDLDCDLFPSRCTTFNDTIDSLELRDVNDDIIFDQYLRSLSPSPSPTPSPDDTASELSGATLFDAGRDPSRGRPELYTETLKSPAPEITPER
jgi:hypothetical protein